jgi:dipeptidase D
MEKKDLKPAGVFKYFEEICQVPRPSKKEEKMIQCFVTLPVVLL